MGEPVRVQLSRKKGWRMPENTVSVARPGRWGNPWPLSLGRDRCIDLFRDSCGGFFSPGKLDDLTDAAFQAVYEANNAFRSRHGYSPAIAARYELAGKNLACWCPLDQPCHADVLLEIANASTPVEGWLEK